MTILKTVSDGYMNRSLIQYFKCQLFIAIEIRNFKSSVQFTWKWLHNDFDKYIYCMCMAFNVCRWKNIHLLVHKIYIYYIWHFENILTCRGSRMTHSFSKEFSLFTCIFRNNFASWNKLQFKLLKVLWIPWG